MYHLKGEPPPEEPGDIYYRMTWYVTPWYLRFFFRKPRFRGRYAIPDRMESYHSKWKYAQWPGRENPNLQEPQIHWNAQRYASKIDFWEDRPIK